MKLKRFIDGVLGRRNALAQPKLEARDPAITLTSLIFATAPKTFTGDAVYVTQSVPKVQATDVSGDDETTTLAKTTSGSAPTQSSRASVTLAAATSQNSATSASTTQPTTATLNTATSAAASASKTPLATAAPASSGGMSGGAKAGLAFGLIILFALIGAGIFFVMKKRKEKAEEEERLDDEKAFFANGQNPDALPAHATANTSHSRLSGGGYYSEKPVPPQPAATGNDADRRARFSYEETAAPRLSLRGVSQFGSMGNLNENGPLSAASSQALPAAGAAALAAAGGLGAAGMAHRDRSNTVNNNDPNNPFGNHAEKLDSSANNGQRPRSPGGYGGRRSPGPQASDFPLPDSAPGSPNASKPTSPQVSNAQVAGGAAAAAGAAAIAAATAAAASNTPQGGPVAENVYRVQIDFKPSMDDELDISAGQLVRVLHEYDDGWALCIRMDRSKQGVVPRTCLSKHPVKPRPASPGGRPGPRGPPPPGMRGPPGFGPPRPHSPASGRNSPGGRSMSPAPFGSQSRPLTPTDGRNRAGSNAPYAQHPGMRAASPGPNGGSRLRHQEGSPQQQRNRSESNAQSGLRNAQTPPSRIPGPVVSRKPVGSS